MRKAHVYHSIPFDTLKSTVADYLVISKSIREQEQNSEMFEFIYEALCVSDQKMNADFHLLFLIQFSRYLGFAPHANFLKRTHFSNDGRRLLLLKAS